MTPNARAPASAVRVVFLDDGGVLNDNDRRAVEWRRLLGEFFAPRLGGTPEAWGEDFLYAIDTYDAGGSLVGSTPVVYHNVQPVLTPSVIAEASRHASALDGRERRLLVLRTPSPCRWTCSASSSNRSAWKTAMRRWPV